MKRGCAFLPRLCACSYDPAGHSEERAATAVLSLLWRLCLLAGALGTRLQPRPPVVILALPHVAYYSCVLAVSATAAVQPIDGEALLLDQALCLLQTCLHLTAQHASALPVVKTLQSVRWQLMHICERAQLSISSLLSNVAVKEKMSIIVRV